MSCYLIEKQHFVGWPPGISLARIGAEAAANTLFLVSNVEKSGQLFTVQMEGDQRAICT
jgi:hypothetical protein